MRMVTDRSAHIADLKRLPAQDQNQTLSHSAYQAPPQSISKQHGASLLRDDHNPDYRGTRDAPICAVRILEGQAMLARAAKTITPNRAHKPGVCLGGEQKERKRWGDGSSKLNSVAPDSGHGGDVAEAKPELKLVAIWGPSSER